jgi:hypothetical protein
MERSRKHPFVSALIVIFLGFLPTIVQPWWSMFSSQPMFPFLYNWIVSLGLPTQISIAPLTWITGPIGLGLLGFILYQVMNQSAKLTIRFDQEPPYVWVYNPKTSYRLGILNNGPAIC